MRLDHRDQVELAVAAKYVLIDGDTLEEAQSFDVIADHELVALGVARTMNDPWIVAPANMPAITPPRSSSLRSAA